MSKVGRPPSGQVIETRGKTDTAFAIRFHAYGRRHYETLGHASEGWTRARADEELANRLADVRRGIWRPPAFEPVPGPQEEPTVHVLASEWVERRRHEVDARTVEHWTWALSTHLLPFFADYKASQVTPALVERYKTGKLAERQEQLEVVARWEKADPKTRGCKPAKALGNESINKTLKIFAQVLDDAVEFGYVEANVARGKRRRLRTTKPRRTWLDLEQTKALIAAAEQHRALLATMIVAGLRVGELCALRWRDIDLSANKLHVRVSKTEAGAREVDITPMLRNELWNHTQASERTATMDLVFGTNRGTPLNRHNISKRILQPAIERANVALEKAGRRPIEGVTNHSLRRTFCALLYEAGATPAYVMAQMGHTDAKLALEVYAKVMERKRDTGERMDALIRGVVWADKGRNGALGIGESPVLTTDEDAIPLQ